MKRFTIGIDEVGRGPLAGPVVVTALALWESIDLSKSGLSLRDSKKLTEHQRTAWRAWIMSQPEIIHKTAYVYPKAIDRLNISRAANLAAYRAYKKLIAVLSPSLKAKSYQLKATLDGGLHLPKHIPHRTLVKADERFPAVSLASIIAKTSRDEAMRRLSHAFPTYGFEEHKGYGTAAHMKALRTHGACEHHRLTFIRNIV